MLPLDLPGITVTNTEPDGPTFSIHAGYETIQVPEQRQVTFGIDIAKLADWLDEETTGQQRLPSIG